MTRLNPSAPSSRATPAVHAMTDVTGFGLLGHALEMARGAGVDGAAEARRGSLAREAEALVQAGFSTGASGRNWASYADGVALPEGLEDWRRTLLTDPQTSGGLLVACAPEAAPALCARIREGGDPHAVIVGAVESGPPRVVVAR